VATEAIEQHFNRYPKGDWRSPLTVDEQIAAIKAVTLDDIKAFHRNFYGASKGELAIVGDFDAPAIHHVVAENFADWKSALPYSRIVQKYFDIPPTHFDLDTPDKENGFYEARINLRLRDDDPRFPALMIANYLFGEGGLNSRLLDRIRQKEGLSYSAGSSLDVDSLDDASSFIVYAIAAPQNLARVDTAVRDELARVLKDGFTDEEVARAKSGLIQQRLQTRAQDQSVAYGWTFYLYLGRTYAWSKALEDRIKALTAAEVNAAFRQMIDPAKLTVAIAGDATKMKAPPTAQKP
jgi:zinc protease